ncbi:glycosyltransferase 61 family protein [uncultured Pseudacidovorax sp.]|uniref:glycosyltransferase family 61 protein n=1 Tax=uncultured Pseudacidovorax sp. TaxID=679313 RepID=UPI0025CBD8C8|nr:glycosyltransferase 61 family protein [uncultured Pseudacidovorax sp.]
MLSASQIELIRKNFSFHIESKEFHGRRLEHKIANIRMEDFSSASVELRRFYGPTRVIGAPIKPQCLADIKEYEISLAVPQFASMSSAAVVGFSAVIDSDDRLFIEGIDSASGREQILAENKLGYHGLVLGDVNEDNQIEVTYARHKDIESISSKALFLHNVEPGNYGSFLLRVMPQLAFAAEQKIEFDCYIAGARSSWLSESIKMLGLPERKIFQVNEVSGVVFDKVLAISGVYHEGFLSSFYRKKMISLFGNIDAERRKIYCSRSLSALARPSYRVMKNEVEVERFLRSRGYDIVFPETLSLSEQIRLFRGSSHVIGPSGSGMVNCLFATPGTNIVDIETFTFNIRQHAKIYSSCELDYSFLFCTPDDASEGNLISSSYVVDIEALESIVE